jgi:hypothetical protein
MVVARKPQQQQQQPAGGGRRRGGGVRVGPARLEGLPAAWAGAAAAAVQVQWPAPGGALSQMLTGRWARGVTAVEAVGAGGTVRWEPRDGNQFRLDDVVGPAGRPERGVFFSVLYVSALSSSPSCLLPLLMISFLSGTRSPSLVPTGVVILILPYQISANSARSSVTLI